MTRIISLSSILCLIFIFSSRSYAEDILHAGPVEVGDVQWQRDYDAALNKSKESGKPVFLFFQEVPGCIGCQNFGQDVLTHPLLVEAIEDEFVPLLIYNNRFDGEDNRIRELYGEPSWNFQVVRFIDGNGKDIIPRKDRVWSVGALAGRMVTSLASAGRKVPLYLRSVALENASEQNGVVGLAMACFWTGEYKLGKIDGVVKTEAGWYDNREITLVTYHTRSIDLRSLVLLAEEEQCAQAVYIGDKSQQAALDVSRLTIKELDLDNYVMAEASDQKKQLQGWLQQYPGLYLSSMQKTKLNSFLPDDSARALQWLSPRQKAVVFRN
jgi:peptide methionine sulfoxide reductase MsrA